MHGQVLHRGDLVRAVITSANRDESQFERADELDVGRMDNRHLAFGLGAHCLRRSHDWRIISLQTLFSESRSLRLAIKKSDRLEWRSGVLFRGLQTLPVSVVNRPGS
ncbi:MAG: hypothetical protein R3C44_02430 [Chloroflexota bacterium]